MNSVRIQITGACVRADVCGGELDAQPRVENQEAWTTIYCGKFWKRWEYQTT